MFNQYIIIALVIACLALGAVGKLLHREIQSHGATSAELAQSQESLSAYVTAMDNMVVAQTVLATKIRDTQNNYAESARKLEALKNRESTVLAKKGLVSIKINKAFKAQQSELACLTGDTTACIKQP